MTPSPTIELVTNATPSCPDCSSEVGEVILSGWYWIDAVDEPRPIEATAEGPWGRSLPLRATIESLDLAAGSHCLLVQLSVGGAEGTYFYPSTWLELQVGESGPDHCAPASRSHTVTQNELELVNGDASLACGFAQVRFIDGAYVAAAAGCDDGLAVLLVPVTGTGDLDFQSSPSHYAVPGDLSPGLHAFPVDVPFSCLVPVVIVKQPDIEILPWLKAGSGEIACR